MRDNTQELEEILRDLASDAGTARDNLHTGRVEGQYERFMNEETQAVNEAKQALLDWHNKQIAKARIDEWNRLISITRINGEQVINQATYSLAFDRIAELSQTLKDKEAEL